MPTESTFTPDPETLLSHQGPMRALARSLLRDEHKAEDVVGEAMLRAIQTPPREPRALRAWLAKVVRRLALRSAQQERVRGEREQRAAREEGIEGDIGASLDAQTEVLQALKSLPEPYRSALHRRYFEDLQPRHIAAQDAAPLPTVKARLRRGLEMLRTELDRRSGGDRQRWASALMPFAQLGGEPGSLGLFLVSLAAAALALVAGSAWQLASGATPAQGVFGVNGGVALFEAIAEPVGLAESRAQQRARVDGPSTESGGEGSGEGGPRRSSQGARRTSWLRSRMNRLFTVRTSTRLALPFSPAAEDLCMIAEDGERVSADALADGSYEFSGLNSCSYELHIDDPRFLPVVRRAVRRGSELEIQLEGNASVELLTLDEDGQTIADARARLRFPASLTALIGQGADALEGDIPLEAEPGADAQLYRGLLPGLPCSLVVDGPGYAAQELSLEALLPGEQRTLVARLRRTD